MIDHLIIQSTISFPHPVIKQRLEAMERELLQELKRMKGVEGKQLTPVSGKHHVESRGIQYDLKAGAISGNPIETVILVSVGSEFPASIKVQPRVPDQALTDRAVKMYGRLPIVTGLHKEAAADLMAAVSFELQAPRVDLVRLCLDVPGKQRSKQYYLNTIAEFLKHCQKPVGKLDLAC